MCDLSVIIVNYNAQHFLQLCLDALEDALLDIPSEVIVIDNVSSDNSCTLIQHQYPWVKLIQNTENVGFGKANNQGASLAQGRHLLILNPDTIVTANTLKQSLALLDKDHTIGAIGVKMLDGSGHFLPESKRGLPTPQVAFYKALGLAKRFPHSKRFARYYLGHLSPNHDQEIEVLAGAYMMIPAAIYRQCNGFDEDFFMYGEDIDLSYRISQLGRRLYYLANAPIIHFKGESTARDAARAQRFYGAMALFADKHFAHKGRLLKFLINAGIALLQLFSTTKTTRQAPIKTSDLDATLAVPNTTDHYHFTLAKRFKHLALCAIDDPALAQAQNIILSPELGAEQQLKLIQKGGTHVRFFFLPKSKDYLLLSPNAEESGQIMV